MSREEIQLHDRRRSGPTARPLRSGGMHRRGNRAAGVFQSYQQAFFSGLGLGFVSLVGLAGAALSFVSGFFEGMCSPCAGSA